MRGTESEQHQVVFGFCTEDRVPTDHPIRGVKNFVDRVLCRIRHDLGEMYSDIGRPSIPPESLLKSILLMALFSVRSERQFCMMLEYNMLFRWFLNMGVMEKVFDVTVFTKNRERLLKHDVATLFFEAVVDELKGAKLLESEHFSVDGTFIKAYASKRSLKKRDDDDIDRRTSGKKPSDIGRNDIYESSTDPDAVIAAKPGVLPMLAYSGNLLIDNKHGLCVGVSVAPATGTAEEEAALLMLQNAKKKLKIRSVGADKQYHRKNFVEKCREMKIIPHVPQQGTRAFPGLDGRTWKSVAFFLSLVFRKKVEGCFGYLKRCAGWRETRYRGTERVAWFCLLSVAAKNIARAIKLEPSLGAA